MAEQEQDPETRERKAFRRVVAASRALAKHAGKGELAEDVASANHNDPSVRNMRQMEALAALLEELAGTAKPAKEAKAESSDEKKKA